MKNLENVSLDTDTNQQKKSVLGNCDCAPECCDTSNSKDEVCCDDSKTEACRDDITNSNCCSDADKQKQDCCPPKENTSYCGENSSESCCDSDGSSCCESGEKESSKIEEGIATIDGTKVEVTSSDTNLVELAKKANITIPAPCYSAK